MNLIVNRPLNQAERQLIYELTLKKRKSKKCHMSASQMLARQQLARELLPHQRIGPMDSLDSFNATTMLVSSSCCDQSLMVFERPSTRSIGTSVTLSTSSAGSISSTGATSNNCHDNFCVAAGRKSCQVNADGGCANLISCSLGSSCSFSRSDSSYSGSSQDSGTQMGATAAAAAAAATAAAGQLSRQTEIELEEQRRANIKLNKIKLDHLNEELERRLYQYQYLVAQEKSILGTYNMMLFTNEGVNNFHLPLRPD